MNAFNKTTEETLLLTKGSRVNAVFVYEVDDVATDISGGSFVWDLFDKEGGTVIDSLTVGYTTDGTDGSITYVYEIAELAAVLADYSADTDPLPAFHEFRFSSDGTAAKYKIWFNGPVEISGVEGA